MTTTPLVIDASVAISWLYPSQTTENTELLKEDLRLGAYYCAPDVLRYEVAYVLWRDVKRQYYSRADALKLWEILLDLPIQYRKSTAQNYSGLLALGLKHAISTYDAAYIQLAEETGAVLATRDKAMERAAKRLGLDTFLC